MENGRSRFDVVAGLKPAVEMTFFRKTFDRLVEHEFHWAGTLTKLAFWWGAAYPCVLSLFTALSGCLRPFRPSQIACLILIAMAVLLMRSMLRERRRALDAHHRFLAALGDLKPATDAERTAGLSQANSLFCVAGWALFPENRANGGWPSNNRWNTT